SKPFCPIWEFPYGMNSVPQALHQKHNQAVNTHNSNNSQSAFHYQ
ncbi:hypothetical protein ECPA4_3029, partial [Escherichia coli PA4]